MAPNTLDPEDALDLLGLDDELTNEKAPDADVLAVEFPPMQQKPPAAAASAAAAAAPAARPSAPSSPQAQGGGAAEAELRKELAALKAARDKAEADRAALEKQYKALQEQDRKHVERGRKAEEELAALKAAPRPAAGPDPEMVRELEALREKVQKLERGGLPSDGEGPAPNEGSLEHYPYAKLLVRLLHQKFTGRVLLKTGTAKREVYFDHGAPVAFSSSEPGERLGRVLVTSGAITEEQYLAAARAMVEQGQKLTEALLEMGAITNEKLQQTQRQTTRDHIVSGFGLTQGTFTLEAGKTPPDEVARFDFSLGEVWLAGYRRYAQESDVASAYDTVKDNYVRAKQEMALVRAQLQLDENDERVLKLLGEAYTLSEAMERAGIEPARGQRLIAALKMLGLIEQWHPGVPEFEARLKTDRLRLSEETMAIKQRYAEREEKLFVEIEQSLRRVEARVGAPPPDAPPPPPPPPPAASPEDVRALEARLQEVESRLQQELKTALERVEQSIKAAVVAAVASIPAAPAVSAPPPSSPSQPAPGTGSNLGTAPVRKTGTNLSGALVAPEAPADGGEDGPGVERYKEGMRQAAAGRLDEAESALREAVRLDAAKPAYLTALARVLLANPRYERSGTLPVVRSLLDRAQTLAPGDPEVSALLQRIQQEMT